MRRKVEVGEGRGEGGEFYYIHGVNILMVGCNCLGGGGGERERDR